MSLGTIDRTPPPFFRQGPSALTKLVLCSALAVFLMAADTRFQLTRPLRSAMATALLPLQQALKWPVRLADEVSAYVQGLDAARSGENAARLQLARQSELASRGALLAAENTRLRALLELRPALAVPALGAEVLYEAADPYARKLFIDRGERHGVVRGSPVINEAGVLGQVTAVYPLSALVTLLTDRDAAIPVLNERTQQRSAAFGGAEGGGALELRFVAANADVKAGDRLLTSGIDGVYPPGLAVGTVTRVDRRADAGFARILLAPAAGLDGVRHLLVLQPTAMQLPPRPEPLAETGRADKPAKGAKTAPAERPGSAAAAGAAAASTTAAGSNATGTPPATGSRP
ncbi:rod shape-determining protein MreC [Aquabacterium sp. OR-4]|uniref:rod shape-determining protein MreC n=1 Tax=Aquabacterium sp. OR-4 TaxID=2978127 RepID=UPI0021B38510|nr:rod shape-determining protein MreC [Aquabacterium sp. OR-4]MDT7833937.1 rod shape-determining protein MreC [Aquabacterium sp. OR-4]